MILALLIAAQTSGTAPPSRRAEAAPPSRYDACIAQARDDAATAVQAAKRWLSEGGGYQAERCEGMALANRSDWTAAATALEAAARDAAAAQGPDVAAIWAQAGNAWLAGSDPVKAKAALDKALAGGDLSGLTLGEAYLDRARALVAAGDMAGARTDLDAALGPAAADPLAWLLSATLARRMGDLPRAHKDIAEALRLSSDDPSVQLEAGNIAAAAGDALGAQLAWEAVVRLRPDSPQADSARAALVQFGKPTGR